MCDLVTPLVKELRKELYSDFCCADNIFATSLLTFLIRHDLEFRQGFMISGDINRVPAFTLSRICPFRHLADFCFDGVDYTNLLEILSQFETFGCISSVLFPVLGDIPEVGRSTAQVANSGPWAKFGLRSHTN